MDSSQERPSGIPRPSRLPVPKNSSGIPRPTFNTSTPPSRPAIKNNVFAGPGQDLHSPKLRTSTSRGQIRPSNVVESNNATPLRQSSVRTTSRPIGSRIVSTPTRRTSAFTGMTINGSPRHSLIGQPETTEYEPQFLNADNISLKEDGVDSQVDADFAEESHEFGTPKPRSSKPRPSLSERTMETLSRLPSSPAVRRKTSSTFFENSPRPSSRAGSGGSRPGSSYNSDGSGRPISRSSSRPGSRGGEEDVGSNNINYKATLSTIDGTPEQANEGKLSNVSTRLPLQSPSKLAFASRPYSRSPSPDKILGRTPIKGVSKTLAARPLKSRPSAKSLFKKPSLQAIKANAAPESPEETTPSKSWTGAIAPIEKPAAKVSERTLIFRKSSAALREQIAQAKAAKRAVSSNLGTESQWTDAEISGSPVGASPHEFGHHDDPFGQLNKESVGVKVLSQRIAGARSSGKLNISALGLTVMPEDVMKMYDMQSSGANEGNWADSVNLTRLVAADNEFETLDDTMFPDTSLEEFQQNEDAPVNIFGGLETMDLHGNKLSKIPVGFRQLLNLTSLNLSSNQLDNESLDIISQMTALRDLKIANNNLSATLNGSLARLETLEILDLHSNKLTGLPEEIAGLSRLRILNIGENSIDSLPFTALAKLPLTELIVRKNKLSGTLIEESSCTFDSLQTLDISSNRIQHLVDSGSTVGFPVLHTLSMAMNGIVELPDLTSWSSLITLSADENNIAAIPESFSSLTKLRQADFSGNDIKTVPPEIARMDNLTVIRLGGNPLRDKKFVTATTDEIKEVLAGRLEPPPPYQEQGHGASITGLADINARQEKLLDDDYDSRSDGDDKFATPPTSAPHSPSHSRSNTDLSIAAQMQGMEMDKWVVKPGGILDRSRTDCASLSHSRSSSIASKHQVRQAQLHHNLFTSIPTALSEFGSTLTALSLAANQIAGDGYLTEILSLPSLQELNLASNRISSMEPVVKFLQAPSLQKMDVSLNRITSIPQDLMQAFPKMTVFLAANNQLSELNPEAIKGLRIVEVSNNDIGFLDPRLGLLSGANGLERLEVSGNRFKVPRWNILEQGTHATLNWLRSRMPADEMARWRQENGENSDVD